MIRLADSPPGLPGSRYYDGLEPEDEMFGLGYPSYLGQDTPEEIRKQKMDDVYNAAIPAAVVGGAGWIMHRYLPKKMTTLKVAGTVMLGLSLAQFTSAVYDAYLRKA